MVKIYTYDINERIDFESIFSYLPKYRQEKINKYRLDKDKKLSLIAGYLLHQGCIELGYPHLDEEVIFNEYGKPFFPKEYNLYFSISHSGNKVVVVFSSTEVGVDIQHMEKDNTSLAKRFFTEKEANIVGNNNDLFYQFWTIKEAYLKATGKGLYDKLSSFEIDENLKISNSAYKVYKSEKIDDYYLSIVIKNS